MTKYLLVHANTGEEGRSNAASVYGKHFIIDEWRSNHARESAIYFQQRDNSANKMVVKFALSWYNSEHFGKAHRNKHKMRTILLFESAYQFSTALLLVRWLMFKMKSYQIMNGRDFNGAKICLIGFHHHHCGEICHHHYQSKQAGQMADGPTRFGSRPAAVSGRRGNKSVLILTHSRQMEKVWKLCHY